MILGEAFPSETSRRLILQRLDRAWEGARWDVPQCDQRTLVDVSDVHLLFGRAIDIRTFYRPDLGVKLRFQSNADAIRAKGSVRGIEIADVAAWTKGKIDVETVARLMVCKAANNSAKCFGCLAHDSIVRGDELCLIDDWIASGVLLNDVDAAIDLVNIISHQVESASHHLFASNVLLRIDENEKYSL